MKTPAIFPAGSLIPPRRDLTLGEKVVSALVLLAALMLTAGVLWVLRFLALPLVLGFLLSYVLGPLADRLENAGMSRSGAVTICFTLLLGAVVVAVVGILPGIESWLSGAPAEGEKSVFEVQLGQRIEGWQAAMMSNFPAIKWGPIFGKLRELLHHQSQMLVEGLPAIALDVASRLGSVALGFVVAFFVMLDGSLMKKAVVALVPNRHFENALLMIHRVDSQISSYLLGTAVENLLVTVIVAIPLWLVGMPNAFLFAVIFGLCNVIPFAGPFIGASAGLLFSLLDPSAPSIAVLVAIYVVVHFIDALAISPLVLGKSLDMHPLTVIVGIAVGGSLGGVVGMLAIIPLIAVSKAVATTISEGWRNAATS